MMTAEEKTRAVTTAPPCSSLVYPACQATPSKTKHTPPTGDHQRATTTMTSPFRGSRAPRRQRTLQRCVGSARHKRSTRFGRV
ncbi:hypothetical protein HN011_000513 [Eciton burchellii]|nr:hypothetical protein HN011_000513 [Eciton burchellii]